MEIFLIVVFLFFLGTIFGSFGSVLVWRIQYGNKTIIDKIKSIIFFRSKCSICNNILGWKDLIPIFSWIFQKGRCRYCNSKISIYYLILEIISGFIFVLTFYFVKIKLGLDIIDINFWLWYIVLVFINWIFFLLVIGDFWFFYLNEFLWIVLFIFLIFINFYFGTLFYSFIGGIIFLFLFWSIYIFGKWYVKVRFGIKNGEGFGFGDVMVAFLIGLSLPLFFGLNVGIYFKILFLLLLIASTLGLIYTILLFFINKKGNLLKKSIPFLPLMIFAWYIILILYIVSFDFLM